MKPERWKRIDEIAQAALEKSEEERAALIAEACDNDDSVRREVESLLVYQQRASSFLESPAIDEAAQLFAHSQSHSLEGQTISHYRLDRLIAHGGMGAVYLAHDSSLDRQVAIKFLSDELTADELARKRLIREARAAAKLDHANICSVYEVAEQDDRTFIVMQYVEGETLAEKIKRVPMEIREVIDVGLQVADALAEAHSRGIVHRDIKPANIMLTARGHVKVLDFGLAKTVRREDVADSEIATESLMSEPGVIAGTVPYMSPEQLRAEAIDARSDIFSFGVLLYEMITGQQPFARDSSAETIAAIQMVEPASLLSHRAEAPEALECIVQRSLQKDREERYQTTRDLLIDLRSLKHNLEFEELWGGSPARHADAQAAAGRSSDFTTARRATSAEYLVSELKQHKRNVIIGLCALMFAVAGAAYFFYFARTAKAIDSIAVLPLVNVSDDKSTEYLSDGISEALINSLTELRQLRVIARATAFRYRGREVDPRAVGRELGVGAVLMGRVRQTGDTLNIQVDLVDGATGAQLWGREYERKVSDVLPVKQAIAREVTQKLGLTLSGEQQQQLTKGETTNADAYQFYLRGRQFLNKGTVEGFKKAINEFEQAIEKDPNYARAWAGLAETYDLLEVSGLAPTSETLPNGRTAAERALQIDYSLAEAHTSLAIIEQHSWNFPAAEREFKRAIELDPNNPRAHQFYGFYLGWVRGRFDDAMAELKQAQQYDPVSSSIGNNIAQVYVAKEELDEAIKQEKKVLELDPYPTAHRILALVYRKQARYDEAFAELEKAIELTGRASRLLADLGVCYAAAGQRDRALAVLKELEEQYDRSKTLGQHIADVYAALGEKEQAFAWLEKDFQTRSGALSMIAYAPRSDILRAALSGDPRWNDLLRRIGLSQN